MVRIVSLLLVAVLAGFGFHVLAQVRTDTRQIPSPIGSSSSNGISFAWFYEATERTVYVCRTGPGDSVDCKARAVLP
jgi:hypothetical protein